MSRTKTAFPIKKVWVATAMDAIAAIGMWAANNYAGTDLGPEFQVILITFLNALVGYIVPLGDNEVASPSS